MSNDIEEKQVVADETQKEIDEARTHYAPCGAYNNVLFFCIRDLAGVDPMYQYSLAWFIRLFVRSIQASEKHENLPTRLGIINDHFTYALYQNICRSLFERHKLLFAFLLDARIMLSRHQLSADQYTFLLTGGVGIAEMPITNPAGEWLSSRAWGEMCRAATMSEAFKKLPEDVVGNVDSWRVIFDSSEPQKAELPCNYGETLGPFERLMLTRMMRPDKVVPAVRLPRSGTSVFVSYN